MTSPTDTPYIHRPSVKDDDHVKNGLMCFKDYRRECGADCMAYGPPPAGPDYVEQQWANCRLLVDSFRSSKHLTIIASCVAEATRLQKNEAADQKRAGSVAPLMGSPVGKP